MASYAPREAPNGHLWPAFLGWSSGRCSLVSVHRSLLVQKPAAIDEELAELRTEMESLINAEAGDMTPFRDAFARFTGLARLSVRRDTAELLRIAGRNDLATAAACLERTNRRRIALHKAQAREDLEQILQQHGVPGSFTTRLDEIVRCIGG